MDRPIIGITSSTENHNNIPSVHVHERFVHSILQSGGTPFVIPLGTENNAETLVSLCNGIVLSSGEDIDPYFFNENPIPQLRKTNGKRDKFEIEIVRLARKQKKPILAICRGITLLNVALGGTVIQDIITNNPQAINHYQQATRPEPTHSIKIKKNSRLFKLFNRSVIRVNSMHHQAINVLASPLKPVALAPDGIIEAVEETGGESFISGIQWHPEEMASDDPKMLQLFKDFVSTCSNIPQH